ncbi:hypothetical protein [Pseudothauera rhizosphaerae]|uniref:Uncharacterized protein n=1 Tax=Pseudothauera rhizosphaerae TaxID=2565932 RepID=A0A4S4ANW5_9RHOO|nr:hypothetical protein [Pseudothauera rhizosphaerae]THF60914.1 hypothetical protein E6O51_11840 [Pseudothauera rhizosphaerae]
MDTLIHDATTAAERHREMANRCDELAYILDSGDWADDIRSQMFEAAGLLNSYAYSLRRLARETA